MNARWRVERNRRETETGTVLLPGWTAYNGTIGALYPTWAEAWKFVLTNLGRDRTIEVALLEAAFPWSRVLPLDERTRFAAELGGHPAASTDDDLDGIIGGWRAAARYANRGLMKARGRAS